MSDSSTTAWVKAMPAVFVLIWSTGFIVARYGMPYAPPFTFLLWRYFFSILCFLPWILLVRVAWPKDQRQMLHLAVTGVLMHAGYLGGVWAAVKAGMGSGLSSLIVGIQPVLTAIWLSTVMGGQGQPAVTRRQWLGLLLGFAGLLMVVWRKLTLGSPMDHVTPVNMAWAVAALLAITIGQAWRDELLRDARQDGLRRLQGVARVLESPRVSMEAGLVEVADMVVPVVEGRLSAAEATQHLRHVQALIPAVRTAAIFDTQGMALAS